VQILKEYALTFVGLPYKWGGKSPLEGYDCSGFIQELMRSVGLDPPNDQTAKALFDHFSENGEWNRLGMGSLLFFGRGPKYISHIAMALDTYRMIEAAGGNSTTLTKQDAIDREAMVRIRLIKSRKDLQAIIRPNFVKIGMI